MNTQPLPSQLGVRPAPALVQQLLVGAFGWMFAGLLLSAGVAYLVGTNVQLLETVANWWFLLLIGQFVLVMIISAGITRLSATAALGLFFVYAATMGLTLGVIVWAYIQTPGGSTAVASAFLSASAMFGAAAIYGGVTKRDLTKLGGILFMALIGLIVASVVNIFLGSSQLNWVISIVGVVIFTALTAWDVQRISRGDLAVITGSPEKGAVIGALHLYLDFVNLFLFLLRLFGGSRS
ncbi:MAG TPA: Bax inhibitor-1/YccA family protein [Candidatus Limnocylindrales bacterium]|jgi:FtsH-binding integral membrane protein|nr:Bax inhibitor-1/YccA family protein [Candidatus Limnocylindrales bacterium]